MMKPGSIFIRLHDRVTPYIEKDEVISDQTVKRLLDSIISESIEQAIQSESVIIGNAINEVHESNHNNTVNRISSLLTGSCVLLLLISMFDDQSVVFFEFRQRRSMALTWLEEGTG